MPGIGHNVGEKLRVKVRDSEATAEAFVDEALESRPQHVHWHLRLGEEVVRPV